MTGRMVLVGTVAALGITVPTWGEIRVWMGAVHSWTAECLAAWDASHSRYRPADAATWVMPSTQSKPRQHFEPIAPDDGVSAIAYELNRMAEGIDLDLPGEGPATARRVPGPRIEILERRLMAELGVALPDVPTEARRTRRRIFKALRPTPCVLSASRSIAVAEEPEARGPWWDPIEPSIDLEGDIAMSLNRFGEGIDAVPASPIARTARGRRFGPIDPASAAIPSLADALNRASEGVDLPNPAVEGPMTPSDRGTVAAVLPDPSRGWPRPASTRPTARIVLALRLTLEAWEAWAQVMAGPGPVRMTAR